MTGVGRHRVRDTRFVDARPRIKCGASCTGMTMGRLVSQGELWGPNQARLGLFLFGEKHHTNVAVGGEVALRHGLDVFQGQSVQQIIKADYL